jgi:hypothetical protein
MLVLLLQLSPPQMEQQQIFLIEGQSRFHGTLAPWRFSFRFKRVATQTQNYGVPQYKRVIMASGAGTGPHFTFNKPHPMCWARYVEAGWLEYIISFY